MEFFLKIQIIQKKFGKGKTKEQKTKRRNKKNKFLNDRPNHVNNYIKCQWTKHSN